MKLIDILSEPWPWYVAGPLIGLMVPILLLIGNKTLGISSSLKHMCAACIPNNIPFFKYDWKKESWNLLFVGGVVLGGLVAGQWLASPNPMTLNPELVSELEGYGIQHFDELISVDLFNINMLFSLKGFILMVVGGFLVGFGTRYAGGCTSGHSIMGLSSLQWPSLVATICFMAGGIVMAQFILPFILTL